VFGLEPTPQEVELVERRLRYPHLAPDPLDDLLGAAPESVQEWQRRKCALADGTRPGLPIVTPDTVLDLLLSNGGTVPVGPQEEDRLLLAAGLLHGECGVPFLEVGRRLGCSHASAHRWMRLHIERVAADDEYARIAAEVLATALRRDHAPRPGDPAK
jgi:hypothetical protein